MADALAFDDFDVEIRSLRPGRLLDVNSVHLVPRPRFAGVLSRNNAFQGEPPDTSANGLPGPGEGTVVSAPEIPRDGRRLAPGSDGGVD
jgi:hypothetical protein